MAFALLCALALALAAGATGAPLVATEKQGVARKALDFYRKEIARFQKETRYWQRVMGVAPAQGSTRTLADASGRELQALDTLWAQRERAVFRQAHNPPHLQSWLCIHRYEGSWTASGGPYYGGLQMDLPFQRTYGGWLLRQKGTADHWSPLEQIWAAVRAHQVRGFGPWPNTARLCGLL